MVATANPGYQLVSNSTCSGTINEGNVGCNFEFKTQHTVIVNRNNGEDPITVTLLYGETYTLPAAPTKKDILSSIGRKRTNELNNKQTNICILKAIMNGML